jgi:hypothetical protein
MSLRGCGRRAAAWPLATSAALRAFVASLAFAAALAVAGPAAAVQNDGSILDLAVDPSGHGVAQPIPKPNDGPWTYSVSFTAAQAETPITFALRDDPGSILLSNVILSDTRNPSTNLIQNGMFALPADPANPNPSLQNPVVGVPPDWTFIDGNSGFRSGAHNPCEYFSTCWEENAAGTYDTISQTVMTNIGDMYTLSFQVVEDSRLTSWSALSTDGLPGIQGNGDDVLVYAGGVLGVPLGVPPPPAGVPEPSTWAMMLIGVGGLAWVARRRSVASARA